MPTGLLLLNLGTPDAPTTPAVRRYLAEFLGDPRVIDINPIARFLLLHLVILRTRPARSARQYATVWDAERGSPLLSNSKDLAAAVAARLGSRWQVELGMRYGNPSIRSALDALRHAKVERIVVMPLFPQYAGSSTGTAIARVMELAAEAWAIPALDFVGAFHADPGFLAAWEVVARPALAAAAADHVLISFHGLPVRHIERGDPYKEQCLATGRALAERLGLADYSVCFQSRLGRTPWIEPYTDVVIDQLARRGVKRLAVLCPAFVADCLETIEEIGVRAREQFRAAGGDDVVLVPSLNATPAWVDAVCAIAERHGQTM